VKALNVTVIVSGSPYDSKMSDYLLLKVIKFTLLLITNKTGRVCVLC